MAIPSGVIVAGRYKIVRPLGEGGFGEVYLAEDDRLGNKLVAVKESFDKSQEAQEQFRLEAQILANLQHPSLPRVTDHFLEPDGRQFLVMDFVEGEDLDQRVIRLGHPLPEREAAAEMLQVCEAVAYLHTRRPQPIIHRDIKPSNIKITVEGRAVLVDFGIAKIYHPTKGTAKIAKAVTPHYSPPEQHIGKTDARSDVYSLGATLYSMVSADVPPDAMDRLNHNIPVISPSHLNSGVSPVLEQIIMKAIELNPDRRYLNANRMAAALRAFLNGQPLPADPGGAVCPRCGWQNRAGARFCIKDGSPLAAPVPGINWTPPPPPAPPTPEMQFEMANDFARKQDYAQAIPRYEACLQQGFAEQAVYYNLGICYLEVGRPAKAAGILEKGATRFPQDADIQYQLARAYKATNQPEKALAAAALACQYAPQTPAHFRLYGGLLFEAKRYLTAARQLERLALLEPSSMTAFVLLGRAYGEAGDYKRALNAERQAAQLDPQSPEPQLWLGIYYNRARKYRDSITALESVLHLDPNSATAYYWIGEAWLQMGQANKALPYYQKAVTLNPREPYHHTRLGQCYLLLKRWPDATAALQQALRIDPGYQAARELMKKLP